MTEKICELTGRSIRLRKCGCCGTTLIEGKCKNDDCAYSEGD